MNSLILAILLTILPITELRAGLPLAISYALENNIPVFLIFILILLINILIIFIIFLFLDFIHKYLMKVGWYSKLFNHIINKFRKKVDKFEEKNKQTWFWGLVLFVAIPLPGTGAWSGCLLAWLLGLDRKKSLLAISLGVLIAGILVLAATLGFVKFLSVF